MSRRYCPEGGNKPNAAFSTWSVGNVLSRISGHRGHHLDPSLLRQVGPIGQQVGQHLSEPQCLARPSRGAS